MADEVAFDKWRAELCAVGRIVQDDDSSVSADDAESRFNRYISMLDAVTGNEHPDYALAILASIQSIHDYGAYQTTIDAALRFGPQRFSTALLTELPRLIEDLPDWAGELLNVVVNTTSRDLVGPFNDVLLDCDEDRRELVVEFVRENEASGWLEHKRGLLAPDR